MAAREADLVVWEALVTGAGKPEKGEGTQHAADALAAAQVFAGLQLDANPVGAATCAPMRPLNLAVVAALHAGLACADPLDAEVLAVRTVGPSADLRAGSTSARSVWTALGLSTA